jgi:DNA polymerase-1
MAADLSSVMLHYVETSAEAADFIEWCKKPRRTVAIDTETTGLERDARIRLIQFGDEDTTWTLRWDRWKGTAVEAMELLKRARQRVVFHNAPYDVPKIERQSVEAGRWEGFKFDWGLIDDTLFMSRLANPIGAHSLKALAARLVDSRSRGMQNVLSDAMAKNNWTWATVPYEYEGYTTYAGIDCVLTSRLLPEIEKMPFDRDLYNTEMTVVEACVQMEEAGLAVDVGYCDQQVRMISAEVEDLVAAARSEFGITALGSDQISVQRLNSLGAYWEDRTDKGRVKLDKDVLGRLAVEHTGQPAGRLAYLILEYRQRVKLMNTYFKNLLEGSEADGRYHPEINTLDAVTGRMTMKLMQQLPRGPRVRRGVLATPGHYLLLADYAQIEIRVLAHYCQDPALAAAIATGDVHTASAQMIFGREDITAMERQLAKSSSLAIIYGAGDEKFSHTAGVTLEAGAAFLAEYHSRFQMVKPFMMQVQNTGRQRKRAEGTAYVKTKDGRRLSMRRADAEYTLVNYLCQGTAADIFKRSIERMHNAGLTQYMRLPVHDEMIFELPNEVDPTEFRNEAVKVMEDFSFRIPMLVEADGPFQSWADKYGSAA